MKHFKLDCLLFQFVIIDLEWKSDSEVYKENKHTILKGILGLN
jgi:hypothetical protein